MKNKILIIIFVIIIIILLLINYKLVDNIDINLIGNNKISLNIDDNWIDPGYTINDNYKDKVNIKSNLDLSKEGTYYVSYNVKFGLFNKKIEREINVFSKDIYTDTIITLTGDNPYYLMRGTEYIEPGVKAYDIYEGNLNNIIIDNNIDNQNNGNYEVIYTVTSNNGIVKSVKRDVIVYSFDFNSKTKYTEYSKNNEIILDISDKQYSYTILPNEEKTYNKQINYLVEENGLYTFNIYDKNNQLFKYEINITNIDNTSPTGTCTLSLNDKGGIISVNALDNNEIAGYEYDYGNNKTKMLSDNKYTITTNDENANVIIYDKANNETSITCKVIDNSTKIMHNYTLNTYKYKEKNYQYWLYSPKDNTFRKKMPLVVYFHGDGGRKSPNDVNKYGLPKYTKVGSDYPFYMIAPYCNNYTDFSSEDYMNYVMDLINYMINNYNIDTDRIIISGGSSGARGAYTIASKYKKFSCMVIISGITYQLYPDKEQNLTYLPIWVFHGKDDQQVNYNDVKHHVDNINSYGGNVLLTTYNGGHNSTDQAFENKDVINWMITQKRR